ncbi:RNA polymerase I termination factor-like [Salvia hispanica]|uniref:RNA polymerase I termination factor-like n=1 Tax=Salvia hispanica TaxID=49212 RepID=UPI0020096CC8|nr:RNA polymerase I termination factor-like [Salvia hispanica]XP_047946592.1 RNA polymerase I termination factor-like [Salvia hispanica]XP_047946594.1 RNA polymerase I termination factor-like [Salvia hispanica]
MDEEGPVVNVNQSNEERIRQKKKDKKKSAKSEVEGYNVDTVKAAPTSENQCIAELNKDHKGGKEKKKKEKKNKGADDAKAVMKSGSRKSELNVVSGENGGGLMIDKAKRDGESSSGLALDNAERKRKQREKKDKNEIVETHDTGEVKRGASINWQEGENASGEVSGQEVMKEKKKQKVKRNDGKVGEKDGDVIRGDSENCMVNAAEIRKEKKGKKKKKNDCFVMSRDTHTDNKSGKVGLSLKRQENVLYDVEDHTQSINEDVATKNNHERKKKKKHKKKEHYKDDLPPIQQEHVDSDTNSILNTLETQKKEAELTNKRKKKKSKLSENGSTDERDNEDGYAKKGKKRKSSLVVKGSDDTLPSKSNKKVRFSDQDEVFPLPPESNTEEGGKKDNLVRAKRFTPEEDEIVKGSVMKYIEDHELGDEGVNMILNSSKHPELKGCWKEIASSIPYRPYNAIYYRARILFMRSESRKWTQEEYDMVLKYQEEHGNKWRALADELGKHTWHVKDTWRRIKLRDRKKGNWSQEEYQRLFDLVNTDLQLKLSEEKRSKHGMLRDNIAWTAISDELSTRAQAACCLKWYNQLTSPMVAQGVWADSDDYRLLSALYSLDATCMEDVGWDDLIDTRDGDLCRKRWNQMVLHLGHIGNKSFAEQVEVLAQRYCPHLLEARETWDSKPRVP